MNETQNEGADRANNPWKIGVYSTVAAVALLVAAGFTFAAFNNSETPSTQPVAASQAAPARAVAAAPLPAAAPAANVAAQPRESCDRYRVGAQRDSTRIAKDGAVGAMIGAGTGAAGGAIADGGEGAGKGAGIGAVVGAVAGAVHGLTQENSRVSDAEHAYQDCLRRNG